MNSIFDKILFKQDDSFNIYVGKFNENTGCLNLEKGLFYKIQDKINNMVTKKYNIINNKVYVKNSMILIVDSKTKNKKCLIKETDYCDLNNELYVERIIEKDIPVESFPIIDKYNYECIQKIKQFMYGKEYPIKINFVEENENNFYIFINFKIKTSNTLNKIKEIVQLILEEIS